MTTNFALSLSFEGIELLHRVQRGWKPVGTAQIEDENLDATLAELREKALKLAPSGMATKLVIPMDQIKYLAIDSTRTNLDDIHAALSGATPYDLNDLVIDYERSGGRTHIAAVARETLQEAQSFASAHNFNPVAFVAVPEPFTFQKEVFFGATSVAAQFVGPDVTVERDHLPVMTVGTRVKSRLLILDPLTEDYAAGETGFDLPPIASITPQEPVSEKPAYVASIVATPPETVPVWIDRIPAEFLPSTDTIAEAPQIVIDGTVAEPAVDLPVDDVAPDTAIVWINRIPREHYPPAPVVEETPVPDAPEPVAIARAAVVAKDPVLADILAMDRIIAEYHARPAPAANPVLTAIAPAVSGATLTAIKPQAARPAVRRKKTPLIAIGLAASIAAAGVFAWSQWDNTADAPVAQQTATLETEITAPVPTAVVAQATSGDAGPIIPTVNILRMAPPNTDPASFVIPVQHPAPVRPDAPVRVTVNAVDIPPQLETSSSPLGDPPTAPVESATSGQVLSPAEALAAYEATGVWQRAPRLFDTPRIAQSTAVALPVLLDVTTRKAQPARLTIDDFSPDPSFNTPANPPAADVVFNLDENGRIAPSADGTVTPEGAVVYAGLPDLTLRERPELTEEQLARMAIVSDVPDGVVVILGRPDVVPPTRPDDIAAVTADTDPTAGAVGLDALAPDAETLAALAPPEGTPRPRARPDGLVPAAPVADPNTPDITSILEGIIAEDGTQPFVEMTEQAVGTSLRPTARPNNFATVVAAARERQASQPAAAPPAAAATVAPQNYAPVPGGVATAATQEGAIRLRDLNLIGIYGRPNAPRALVRLGNGRYAHVEVGSSLDGGQVTAIGNGVLNYVKRGRTIVLELPGT